ncbi:MAG: hypothetical protein P8Y18_02235, partial [Candidatus Bathyarchaeota archaeon]
LIASVFPLVNGSSEIDTAVSVNSIIDGVTFETKTQGIFKLADIEHRCTDIEDSTGLVTTKGLLSSLILGKNVYLDIDNQYITDNFGAGNRTIAVAYIDHNSTHYLNVNQALIEYRYVIINDVENDFNPEEWTLFINKQTVPEFPILTIILLFLIITLSIIFIRKNFSQTLKNKYK